MNIWQLQDAKNKFSRLVNQAQRDGPQVVIKHGRNAVVVLSFQDYKRLTQQKQNLVTFLQKSPLKGLDLEMERNKDNPREIDF